MHLCEYSVLLSIRQRCLGNDFDDVVEVENQVIQSSPITKWNIEAADVVTIQVLKTTVN